MSARVLLCDDWRLLRVVLKRLLRSAPDIEVIGEADGGKSAIALAARLHPDFVLMDFVMPDMNGIEATRQIVTGRAGVKVLAVSMHSESMYVWAMIEAGASGYVVKSCAREELAGAIRAVAAGQTYLSPCLGIAASRLNPGGPHSMRIRIPALNPQPDAIVQSLRIT